MTPYNTGKVKIGIAYTKPIRTDFTQEEYFIQKVLLGEKSEGSNLKFVAGLTILGVVLTLGILLG